MILGVCRAVNNDSAVIEIIAIAIDLICKDIIRRKEMDAWKEG